MQTIRRRSSAQLRLEINLEGHCYQRLYISQPINNEVANIEK